MTKSHQNNIDSYNNAQVMEDQLPVGGSGNGNGYILPTAIPMDAKLRAVVPHVLMRLCAKYGDNRPLDGAVFIFFLLISKFTRCHVVNNTGYYAVTSIDH